METQTHSYQIAYICKYAPAEALEACGVNVFKMEPAASDFTRADTLMHANVCSFVRAVLEDFADHDYDGMLLTSCCDSSRRLYDALVAAYPDRFFFCLDLPHKINDFAVTLYEKQIRQMLRAWESYAAAHPKQDGAGIPYTASHPKQDGAGVSYTASHPKQDGAGPLAETAGRSSDDSAVSMPDAASDPLLTIGLVGARPGAGIRQILADKRIAIGFDMTCTGAQRDFPYDSTYATRLLNQLPCMRMAKASGRQRFYEDMSEHTDGIIYHTVKFCDVYSYEYAQLQKNKTIPILKIETDATLQSSGQILTRLEAFFESLLAQKASVSVAYPATQSRHIPHRKDTPMYVLGIDSGSTSTNGVLLDSNRNIKASAVLRTGPKSAGSADRILQMILEQADLKREDITTIVSTGYGRVSIPFADLDITEISCHAKGAHFVNPEVRTILDIGGQDSKAIRLDENGNVKDFVMNDKCAAGTGRFLEMMARTLEVELKDLGPLSLQSKNDLTISSMCTVFAESEVISLIAQNKDPADIAHGIHEAIVSRAMSLLRRTGLVPAYMMTGGVARNEGVIKVLEERLEAPVFRYKEPDIVGALGAALFGLEQSR